MNLDVGIICRSEHPPCSLSQPSIGLAALSWPIPSAESLPMTDLSEMASAFWRVIPADPDPGETREWLDAFESMLAAEGAERATFILRALLDQARAKGVKLPPVFNTPYCNTI